MFLFKNTAVGLDLDACEIRAVELKGSSRGCSISSWGRIPLPQGAVEEGIVLQPDKVGEALKRLWSNHGIQTREVTLGISNNSVLVRFASFPRVAPEKLDKLIKYQAQEHLPLPLSSVVLDYMVVGETQKEGRPYLDVLLVAAKRDMLGGFLTALEAARLVPLDIDVTSLALLRMIPEEDREKTIAMVNIENDLGNIVISVKGVPRLARLLPVSLKEVMGTYSLKDIIDSDFILKSADKESLENWGIDMAYQISSSVGYYQSKADKFMVEKIILCGGGSRVEGLTRQLQQNLNIPVELIKPLQKINYEHVRGDSDFNIADFTVCMSVAIRGLEE